MEKITQTIGFLGSGRMATALAKGCVQSGLIAAQQVLAADPFQEAQDRFAAEIPGVQLAEDNKKLLEQADMVVLAVKPQVMPAALAEISQHAKPHHLFVSIAAGITLEKLESLLPAGKLIRVMPNTPCLVSMGASCYSLGRQAGDNEGLLVKKILASVGSATQVEEPMLDAVTGLSGSGPAFIYTVIEALAAGGAAMGLSPELALELATQTARGAAEMLRVTGNSPEELRNQVTSPGGTTLAGLERLKELEGAAALSQAVEAATKRSLELGQA